MHVYINGRFLSQRTTGVQRYARETLSALDGLLAESAPSDLHWTLLLPPGTEVPGLARIEVRIVGRRRGHAWEQLDLPIAARDGLLWSFGPTGPLLHRHQVVTMHDAAVYRVPEGFSRAFGMFYRLLMPTLARITPHTMTVSEFSRAELSSTIRLPHERCTVSGEGHEHVFGVEADPRILAKHGLERDRYVLAVSSVTPYKNFEVVAEALSLLERPDFQVVIAGAHNARVFGALGKGVLDRLVVTGYVSDEELRALYENAALFVFPSRYEGFGLPPLEAMALGCPVIAARAAAMPEVCGEGALYFDPDDPAGLAVLMQRLMRAPDERAALARLGRARAAQHRWQDAARVHLRVAEQVSRSVKPAAGARTPRSASRVDAP